MTQPLQADLSEAAASTSEFSAFAPAASGALLPAQKDTSAGSAALDFTAKEEGGAGLKEPRGSPDQNSEPETGYLLKLVASLESCNMSLLSKLNQAERELAALRQPPAYILPGTEPIANPEQSFGWERKLTRTQWRPS